MGSDLVRWPVPPLRLLEPSDHVWSESVLPMGGGGTRHNTIRLDVVRHDGMKTDHGSVSDCHSAHNDSALSDPDVVPYEDATFCGSRVPVVNSGLLPIVEDIERPCRYEISPMSETAIDDDSLRNRAVVPDDAVTLNPAGDHMAVCVRPLLDHFANSAAALDAISAHLGIDTEESLIAAPNPV